MKQRRNRVSSRPRQLGIIVTVVALVGVGGWFAGTQMQSPADAAAAHQPPKPGAVTVAVTRRSLTASVVAQGSVEYTSPQSLALAGPVGSPDAGSTGSGSGDGVTQRVTKAPTAGKELKEGDVLMQVSGRPVLVLRGSVPMYRTLGPGTSGDDVKQLQQALARLGYFPQSATGEYGQATATAVTRWYKSKGFLAEAPTVADKQQLGELETTVTTAQQQLLAAEDPDGPGSGSGGSGSGSGGSGTGTTGTGGGGTGSEGSSGEAGKLQLKAAHEQLDTANAALSAFQDSYGTKVPAGEIVFLPELPARLDKVTVKTGDTPSGPIGTVTGSTVVIQAVVPAGDAKLLHKGMAAQVETPDGTEVAGELAALGDEVPPDDSTDGGTAPGSSGGGGDDASAPVPLEISVESGQLSKNAGGSAKVTIKVGSSNGEVLTVPIAGLHTSADGQAHVQVKRGSTVVSVPVEVGLSAEGQVQVTPTGDTLKVGDQVVVGQ